MLEFIDLIFDIAVKIGIAVIVIFAICVVYAIFAVIFHRCMKGRVFKLKSNIEEAQKQLCVSTKEFFYAYRDLYAYDDSESKMEFDLVDRTYLILGTLGIDQIIESDNWDEIIRPDIATRIKAITNHVEKVEHYKEKYPETFNDKNIANLEKRVMNDNDALQKAISELNRLLFHVDDILALAFIIPADYRYNHLYGGVHPEKSDGILLK